VTGQGRKVLARSSFSGDAGLVLFAQAADDDEVILMVTSFVNMFPSPSDIGVLDLLDVLAQLDEGQRILALQQFVALGVDRIAVEEALAKLGEATWVEEPPVLPQLPPPPGPLAPVARKRTGLRIVLGLATTITAIGVGYAIGKRVGRRL
jgi:hypothetical protein